MAALAGAGVGAAVGGLSGALIGLGIPEYEAKQYEGKISQGNILISVHSEDRDEVKRAKEIFERAGAHEYFFYWRRRCSGQREASIWTALEHCDAQDGPYTGSTPSHIARRPRSNLNEITALEQEIVPDLSGGGARVSLAKAHLA
jgi:hypothetical protein